MSGLETTARSISAFRCRSWSVCHQRTNWALWALSGGPRRRRGGRHRRRSEQLRDRRDRQLIVGTNSTSRQPHERAGDQQRPAWCRHLMLPLPPSAIGNRSLRNPEVQRSRRPDPASAPTQAPTDAFRSGYEIQPDVGARLSDFRPAVAPEIATSCTNGYPFPAPIVAGAATLPIQSTCPPAAVTCASHVPHFRQRRVLYSPGAVLASCLTVTRSPFAI